MSKRISVVGLPFYGERAAAGLREAGFDARHARRPASPFGWPASYARLLRSDLIYAIGSSVEKNSPLDLLARARRRILLHWVGSDVEHALGVHGRGRTSPRLVRATHWVDAPWLADELLPLGIRAQLHPLPIPTAIGEPAPLPETFRVLVYLPEGPSDVYDVFSTLEVMRALPGITFLIAGGFEPALPLPNVQSLGYVQDMPALYRDCAAFLRLTRHDGMSHSVIEALSFGRYVVWSRPTPGALLAHDTGEAVAALRGLHQRFLSGDLPPNLEGATAVTQTYGWSTMRDELTREIDQLLS